MLLTLPTEILIEIFGNLDYLTLRRSIVPICRRFRSIILEASSGPLASALFRSQRPRKWLCGDLSVHPCLAHLALKKPAFDRFRKPKPSRFAVENIGFLLKRGKFVRLQDTPMAEENATYPPQSSVGVCTIYPEPMFGLIMEARHTIEHEGQRGKPVSVSDVVEQFSKTMIRPEISEPLKFRGTRILKYTKASHYCVVNCGTDHGVDAVVELAVDADVDPARDVAYWNTASYEA